MFVIDSGEKEVDDKETLQRFIKSFANKAPFNNSANITEVLENIITSSFNKICRNTGDWNVQSESNRLLLLLSCERLYDLCAKGVFL